MEAAIGASHSKNTYLAAQYRRIASRGGGKKATIAVGHTILTIIYHLLTNHQSYQELGGGYFDARERQLTEKRLIRADFFFRREG